MRRTAKVEVCLRRYSAHGLFLAILVLVLKLCHFLPILDVYPAVQYKSCLYLLVLS